MKVYIEPRDWWVGVYRGLTATYVCPLPCLVFKFDKPVCPECGGTGDRPAEMNFATQLYFPCNCKVGREKWPSAALSVEPEAKDG